MVKRPFGRQAISWATDDIKHDVFMRLEVS